MASNQANNGTESVQENESDLEEEGDTNDEAAAAEAKEKKINDKKKSKKKSPKSQDKPKNATATEKDNKKKHRFSLRGLLHLKKKDKNKEPDVNKDEPPATKQQGIQDGNLTPTDAEVPAGSSGQQDQPEADHGKQPGLSIDGDVPTAVRSLQLKDSYEDVRHISGDPHPPQGVLEEDNQNSDSSESGDRYEPIRCQFRCFIVEPVSNNEVYRRAIKIFINRVKESLFEKGIDVVEQYVAPNEDAVGEISSKPSTLLIPCLAPTNVENAMNIALDKVRVTRQHNKLAVVFHPRATHDTSVPSSRRQVTPQVKARCSRIVDVVFNRQTGDNFSDNMTQCALKEITDYIEEDVG